MLGRWRSGALLLALVMGTATPPASADTVVLASLPAGDCVLSAERPGQEPRVLRVRASHPRYAGCQISQAALGDTLRAALAHPSWATQPAQPASLFLGRLVDFPWLSAYLARAAAADPGWNARLGKPVRDEINHYVGTLLSRAAIVETIEPALVAGGYRIAGASVEKVLVGPAQRIPALGEKGPSGRLPFDAQLWFRLEPVP